MHRLREALDDGGDRAAENSSAQISPRDDRFRRKSRKTN
jgi:hypothetical protein